MLAVRPCTIREQLTVVVRETGIPASAKNAKLGNDVQRQVMFLTFLTPLVVIVLIGYYISPRPILTDFSIGIREG